MRRFLPMLLGLTLGLTPMTADAQQRPVPRPVPEQGADEARAGKVVVRVMEVYATDTHKNVDPKLSRLTRYLDHLRFTGYELLDTHTVSLSPNGKQSFSIAGGRKMEITIISKDDRRVKMRVQVTAGKGGKLLDTTLSVNRNGTFIVAGPKHKDGVLVLPLTAKY